MSALPAYMDPVIGVYACPQCGKPIPWVESFVHDDILYAECPHHGYFSAIYYDHATLKTLPLNQIERPWTDEEMST